MVRNHWRAVREGNFVLKGGMKIVREKGLKAVSEMSCLVGFLVTRNKELDATIVALCDFKSNGSSIGVRHSEIGVDGGDGFFVNVE